MSLEGLRDVVLKTIYYFKKHPHLTPDENSIDVVEQSYQNMVLLNKKIDNNLLKYEENTKDDVNKQPTISEGCSRQSGFMDKSHNATSDDIFDDVDFDDAHLEAQIVFRH